MKKTFLFALLCAAACLGLNADELLFPNSNFEKGDLTNWTAEGDAFKNQPTQGDNPAARKRESAKHEGDFWIGTFENNPKGAHTPGKIQNDAPQGKLTSKNFKITHKYLTFLIGGGRNPTQLYVDVVVDGKTLKRTTGNNKETMTRAVVDLRNFQGKTARIEIHDRSSDGWGHINADDFRWSDDDALLPDLVDDAFALKIDKDYLWIPVGNPPLDIPRSEFELLSFIDKDGTALQTLNAHFPKSEEEIAWWAYYPVSQWKGKTLTISVEGLPPQKKELFRKIKLMDAIATADDDYQEPYRNRFHFSPHRGWNNDVNGLYWRDGLWHLMYQHNPLGVYWQNMHWGHAVSKDLIHWENRPMALLQNGIKDMMFSGTAFVDKANTSKLDPSGKGAVFLAFTSTGRGECLAYSLDDGATWQEVDNNPVIKHAGRDPKVFWHEPTKKWVLIVYSNAKKDLDPPAELPFRRKNIETHPYPGYNFAIYTSSDLREWEPVSNFTMPDRSTVYECPDLVPLPVDGDPKNTKWVVWGVMQYYHIGDFDGKTFTPMYPYSLTGVDDRCRAAIVFDNAPDKRTVLIGWTGDGWPGMVARFPDLRFSQGMTLPMDLSLKTTPDGIRLFAYPVKEIEQLRGKPIIELKNTSFAKAKAALEALNGPETKWLDIVIEYKQKPDTKLTLHVDGLKTHTQMNTRGDFITEKDGQPFTPAPTGELRMLVDTAIIDCYLDKGRRASVKRRNADKIGTTELILEREGDAEVTSLTVYPMQSIWNK